MIFRHYLSLFAAAAISLQAVAADYASSSRLAQGHWVKVHVTEEGIQEISHEQLRQWGFSEPERVQAFGYGATALTFDRLNEGGDDLPPTPTVHTGDGRMLFYADADVRFDLRDTDGVEYMTGIATTLWRHNVYDSGSYYFLGYGATGDGGTAIPAPESTEGATVYNGHYHVDATDIDRVAPLVGGNVFCERTFTAANPYRAELRFRDAVSSETEDGPGRKPVFAYYGFAALGAEIAVDGVNCVDVSIDGAAAGLVDSQRMEIDYFSNDNYITLDGAVRFSDNTTMPDGSCTVTLSRPSLAEAYDYYLDRHALIYTRLNRLPADISQLIMHYPAATAGAVLRIADAAPSMQLWDISDPADVRIHELRPDGDGDALAAMPAGIGKETPGRLILFDTERPHLQPEFAGEVAAQNLHSLPTPDMLIITTDENEPEALRLAAAHKRIDGLEVAVCRSRDIYNEFSCGVATPAAYRRLAHMFHTRDAARFRYVLLLGSSVHDHRGLQDKVRREVLAVHEAALPAARMLRSANYASDSYVGWMDPTQTYIDFSSARMDIAVGRLPAKDIGEARAMVSHTIDYMENPPQGMFAYRALMGSGTGDSYEHYNFSLSALKALQNGQAGIAARNVPIIGYSSPAEASRHFCDALREGCGFVCFFGHSVSGRDLGSGSFYSDIMAERLDYNVYPMAMLATCSAFHIDSDLKSVGVSMVGKEHGGAIACIAATRSVYSSYNRDFAVKVSNAYAAGTYSTTSGDIFRNAHNAIVSGNTLPGSRFNTKCYNLCGDPAVRLPFAGGKAVLESCTNADGTGAAIKGNAMVELKGFVDSGDGATPDESFDGTVSIDIFDTPVPGTVMAEDTGTKPSLTIENIRLARVTADVIAGRWAVKAYMPPFSRPGEDFSLSIDATASDGRMAHAYRKNLHSDSETGDGHGIDSASPSITEMYVESPSFADGDIIACDGTTRLHARIAVPSTGINVSAAALRGSSRYELDKGSAAGSIAGFCVPASDGSGDMLVDIPLSNLAGGRHEVRLCVSSGSGGIAERTIGFTVGTTSEASLTVEEEPARTAATFSISHSMDGTPDITLVITDPSGNTVRTLDGSSLRWDLRDSDGNPVADGVYSAHALLRSGMRHSQTGIVELIVLRDGEAQ